MKGDLIRSSYGYDTYGVVPPVAPDFIAICVLLIPLPHHTISRRHPRILLPNAASGGDRCECKPSRCVSPRKRKFRSAHQGETCTSPSAAHVGWVGTTGTADVESSLCTCIKCVIELRLCSSQFSLVVS